MVRTAEHMVKGIALVVPDTLDSFHGFDKPLRATFLDAVTKNAGMVLVKPSVLLVA